MCERSERASRRGKAAACADRGASCGESPRAPGPPRDGLLVALVGHAPSLRRATAGAHGTCLSAGLRSRGHGGSGRALALRDDGARRDARAALLHLGASTRKHPWGKYACAELRDWQARLPVLRGIARCARDRGMRAWGMVHSEACPSRKYVIPIYSMRPMADSSRGRDRPVCRGVKVDGCPLCEQFDCCPEHWCVRPAHRAAREVLPNAATTPVRRTVARPPQLRLVRAP